MHVQHIRWARLQNGLVLQTHDLSFGSELVQNISLQETSVHKHGRCLAHFLIDMSGLEALYTGHSVWAARDYIHIPIQVISPVQVALL